MTTSDRGWRHRRDRASPTILQALHDPPRLAKPDPAWGSIRSLDHRGTRVAHLIHLDLRRHRCALRACPRQEYLRGPANVARSRRVGWRHVIAPQLAAFRRAAHRTETEAGIVPGNHAVFLGRDIDTHDLADATRLALFDQSIKHGEFHLALHHATAHQPKVELHCLIRYLPDQDRHQTVVSKSVSQPPVKCDKGWVLGNGLDFTARIPPGCEIELIGLVDQLCDSLQIDRKESADLRRHFDPRPTRA